MKTLGEMYTPKEVDQFIKTLIDDHQPGLRERVEAGKYTPEELATDLKVEAMYNALKRRAQLEDEIHNGTRSPSGELIDLPFC